MHSLTQKGKLISRRQVFSKDTKEETREVEDVIAQIARFVYDYFYFTSDTST